MLALAALIAVMAGGLAPVLVERAREQRLRELGGRATRMAELLGQSLAQPLWNVDRRAIDRQLAALAPNPELAEITVTAVGYGAVATVAGGHGTDPAGIVRVRPIEYAQFDGFPPQRIGEVRVVFTRAVAEHAIARARRTILGVVVAIVLALDGATYLLLKYMVRHPVRRLEEMVDRIAGGDLAARCPAESGDELGRLARRVNAMAERLRDSTARLRESEAKYRDIVEHALEGIFQLTRDGRVRDANPAMAALLGYATPAELLAAAHADPRACMLPRPEVDALFQALAAKGEVAEPELRLTRRDGSSIWVQLNARGVGGTPQEPAYLEGLVTDVTARKLAVEELRAHRDRLEEAVRARTAELVEAKERAEVASRAKTAFIANVSHELRTPLNGLLGLAQVLRLAGAPGERLAAGLSTIQRCGEHLRMLIDDLLDVAKIESGRFELGSEPVNVGAILDELYTTLRLEAERKRLAFEIDRPRTLPRVRGDARRLRQVLTNLLGNAVKFTDEGRVTLAVERLACEAPAAARLRFSVRDTGIGIAAADLARIFEPFEQAETRWRSQGTGLGLALSRHLVTQMGGRLEVESAPGRGSTFWFVLTLALAGDAERAPRGTPMPVTYAGPRRLVLVADDVDLNRTVVCEMLRLYGFDVLEARDGEEAVALGVSREPALVFMDVRMPRLDGLEAIRRLRQTLGARCMPIVAVSASAADEDRQQAAAAGAADFLTKPVMQAELLATLAARLDVQWVYGPGESAPPLRILLVEDHPDARESLRMLLDLAGHQVFVAADGHDGLETLRAIRPDVALVDIGLPGLDGYALARTVRADPALRATRLVALTGHGQAEDRARARAAGFDAHLTKPVEPDALQRVLAEPSGRPGVLA
jgi:PAS domain S-box-containing protein